jgi:hypothetical protein
MDSSQEITSDPF